MKEIINKHVIDWVEDNILSLEHIDRLVVKTSYSRRTLEMWFKHQFLQSLGEYMLRRRMSYAASLLRMTSLPVTEIAHIFQYHSGQGFARAFKKLTGKTPSQYRSDEIWDFQRYHPSLLLEGLRKPDVKICRLARTFSYNDTLTEYDHIFNPAIQDVTKRLRKLLLDHRGEVKKIAIRGRRPEGLDKSRENMAEVIIDYLSPDNTSHQKQKYHFSGKYAVMRYDGSWCAYGKLSKKNYFYNRYRHQNLAVPASHVAGQTELATSLALSESVYQTFQNNKRLYVDFNSHGDVVNVSTWR